MRNLIFLLSFVFSFACNHSQEMKTGYAEVNGTKLYFEQIGKGHPVILLHGFTLDTRMWDDQFEIFGEKYKVLRYDLRGFGKSELPTDEKYNHSDDLKGLMDYLDLAKAYLVGLSGGGRKAINFTLDYPEYVDALVTVDATLQGYQWSPEYNTKLDSIIKFGWKAGHDATLERWLNFEIFIPAMRNSELAIRLREIISDYSGYYWSSEAVNWDSTTAPPAIERLNDIKVPTLAIVGSLDSPDFDIIASMIAEQVPDAKKVVIQGAGHMPNMEKPGEFNQIVLDFLKSIEK